MEKNLGKKFLKASLIYLTIGVIFGTIMTIQPIYVFTVLSSLFVRAHAHIGLIGWVSMSLIGFIYLLLERLDKKLYSERLGNMGFWLLNIGIIVEFIVLLFGGYVQANAYQIGDPNAHGSTKPFTMFIMIFAFVMMIGILLTIYNLYKSLDKQY